MKERERPHRIIDVLEIAGPDAHANLARQSKLVERRNLQFAASNRVISP